MFTPAGTTTYHGGGEHREVLLVTVTQNSPSTFSDIATLPDNEDAPVCGE
jgi:hypothetical protein